MDKEIEYLQELTTKGLYSTDLRGKPMTVETFYDAITVINKKSEQLQNYANLGFYKVGQLLSKANYELAKGDWGKLRKKIAEGGLHIKQQERYMAIARNKNIMIETMVNAVLESPNPPPNSTASTSKNLCATRSFQYRLQD